MKKKSLTDRNKNKTKQLEDDKNADSEEIMLPYVATDEELYQYIKRKMPKWIEEVKKLSKK